MSFLTSLKEYWKIVLLIVLLIGSTAIIVAPDQQTTSSESGGNAATVSEDSILNLKYGLELAGGTSVRAPLVGVAATDVQIERSETSNVTVALEDELNVASYNVRVRHDASEGANTATVEVYKDIDPARLGAALEDTSANTSEMTLSDELSEETYNDAEDTLHARIDQSGLSGGQVTQSVSADGSRYLIVKVPNEDQQEVLDLVQRRGLMRVVGVYPVDNKNGSYDYKEETIVTQEDIHSVGQLDDSGQGVGVPITLTDDGGKTYVDFLEQNRYLSEEGVGNCDIRVREDGESSRGFCLLTYQDDTFVHGGGISPGLAEEMRSGDFENSPTVVLSSENRSEAQKLQVTLRAGAMPSRVDVSSGTVQYLSPSQASEFKIFSLVIGLLTVLAVSGAVAYRYRDPAIAAPMTLTALSEVWLLLGFVAVVQLPLDLSHIAGLIAVVGTGVDDLIIIADEVMAGGDVSTKRVFQSRFKKAFWVIGVAAITTIIAMSPLAVLSLGDLQGFAIVTIVGVLIGVLVTRPAYGDILQYIVEHRNN